MLYLRIRTHYIMNRFTLVLLLIVVFIVSLSAQRSPIIPEYHSAIAKNGDGVYSLLRRYSLGKQNCNVRQFYAINDLEPNEALHKNKKYKLPVLIYKYNGKSIRTTLGISDLQKAIRIKDYNEVVRKAKLRNNNFLESKVLWVPYHELYCKGGVRVEGIENDIKAEPVELSNTSSEETTDTPTSVSTTKPKTETTEVVTKVELETIERIKTPAPKKTELKTLQLDLFGEKYKNITIENNSLENKVYYIVSGHGGPDPGAQCLDCKETLCEDEYAYDVALRLARNLLSRGATVHMIVQDKDGIRDAEYLKCDTDETCLGKLKLPRNQKLRLLQRTTAINDLYSMYRKRGIKEQKMISIHIDSNTKDKKMDTYFCYFKASKRSKSLAENLQKTFKKKYKKYQKNRGYNGRISPRGFYILRNTMPEAVLVELANIKNKNNQKRFMKPSNRQLLADWLYEGMTGASL